MWAERGAVGCRGCRVGGPRPAPLRLLLPGCVGAGDRREVPAPGEWRSCASGRLPRARLEDTTDAEDRGGRRAPSRPTNRNGT